MASSLGEAVLDLSADDAKLKSDIDKAGSNALKQMDAFGTKMRNLGMNMTKAITLPLIGAAGFMVKGASDLEESMNAVNVVFGEGADILHDFGQTAATEVGLARSEFNQLGAVTGAFLKNLGYDEAAAADETINLTRRAADMASVMNSDVSTALAAIQSGLKGEFNPLEQFAVKMNATTIALKALEMGLAPVTIDIADLQAKQVKASQAQDEYNKAVAVWGSESDKAVLAFDKYVKAQEAADAAAEGVTGELTDQMKAQAALAILYEQTEQFAGDFKNTEDGLANSLRQAKAQLKDASDILGLQLIPYVTQAVKWFSELIAKFQGLTPEQQKWILLLGGAAAILGPLLMVVGSLVTALAAIIPVLSAIGAPLLIIIAALGLLYLAWTNNWGGIQEKVQAFWSWLQPILLKLWEWLKTNIPVALQALSNFWTGVLLPALQAVWNFLSTYILPLFEAVGRVIMAVIGNSIKQWAAFITNILVPALKQMWDWIEVHILPSLQKFAKWVAEKVKPALEGIGNVVKDIIGWLNGLANSINNLSLPDWLTPGSPTPFEIGLRGVDDALMKLSNASLPSFSAGLGAMPGPAVAGGVTLGGAGGFVFNYQPMISTADEYEARRVLFPLMEAKLREWSKR